VKTFLQIILTLLAISLAFPAMADEEEAANPIRVTIQPLPKFRFGDFFSYGADQPAPRVEELFLCPPGTLFACEVFRPDPLEQGDPFTIRLNRVVAAYVYEKSRDTFGRPDIGLLMGKRYYGLPRYVILAQLGIDPDLKPLTTFPRPTGAMYGGLWFADTLNLGDRIAGPIMLTRGGPSQIELLGGKRKHFSGS